jgi:hypothetical protein
MVELPKLDLSAEGRVLQPGSPGWIPVSRQDGTKLKPIVRCNCGLLCGLGLHHIHPDGTVTASFFHSKGDNFEIGESPDGCGWHEMIKFLDYDLGEFPPR